MREDDQGADRPIRPGHGCGGTGDHAVHEPRRGLRAGQRPGQLGAAVHRDGVRRDQVHTPRLQGQAVGDRSRGTGPGRGCTPAGHLVQVMLGHRRGLQRDLHDLVRGDHAQVSRGGQVRATLAGPLRKVRHRVAGHLAPGQVRSRRARLLARLAPALAPLRLRRRRRAAGQVISRRRHRGIPAVTAQTAPQIPDLRRQRHHVGPQLPDRCSLLRDHRVPCGARRATRCKRRQNGHNQPSLSSAPSDQADTLSRDRKDRRGQPARQITGPPPNSGKRRECLPWRALPAFSTHGRRRS